MRIAKRQQRVPFVERIRREFAVGLNMQTRFFQIVVILDESARVEGGYVLQLLRAESKQGAWKRINYGRVHGS